MYKIFYGFFAAIFMLVFVQEAQAQQKRRVVVPSEVTNFGSGTRCADTIIQVSHGFSPAEAVYWNGTSYVSMLGLYGDNQAPHYLVLDSVSANQFIAVACGIYDEDFGRPNGTYFWTDTGLSITPDTVEYPMAIVFNGKCHIIASLGFEFNATGRPLLDVVTPTGQRTLTGGDVIPMFPDSIPFVDTIDGTPVENFGDAFRELKDRSLVGDLDDLTDVTITSPAYKQVLMRIGAQWINRLIPMIWDTSRVALGYGAGLNSVPGNTATTLIGYDAGRNLTTGSTNVTAIGYGALDGATNVGSAGVTAVGVNALGSASYNTNQGNTAVGTNAGANISTGNGNTIVGGSALSAGTTAFANTIVGHLAGAAISTGQTNTIIGYEAGRYATANSLTAVGYRAMGTNGVAYNYGVAVGSGAGGLTSGTFNGVAVGLGAVEGTTGFDFAIAIGNYSGQGLTTANSATIIGDRVFGEPGGRLTKYSGSNAVAVGSSAGMRGMGQSSVFLGTAAGCDSYAPRSIMIGNQAKPTIGGFPSANANGLRGDTMTLIGNSSANVPFDTLGAKTTPDTTAYNITTDVITLTGHGFGATGDYVNLLIVCSTCPAPFVTGNTYMFQVVDANSIFSNVNFTTKGGMSTTTYYPRKRTNSAITVGSYVIPEERKIKLGTTTHQQLVANRYKFNIDQSLTGLSGLALRYNLGSGEIQLQPDTNRLARFYEAAVNGNNHLTLNIPAMSSNVTYDAPTVLPVGESGYWETAPGGTSVFRRTLGTKINGSTDANGDVVINHNFGDAVFNACITPTGTTILHAQPINYTTTTITIRFWNLAGVPLASTVVQADVELTDR